MTDARADAERPGYLVQLHTDTGARRRVGGLELFTKDKLIDIRSKERTRIERPFVFVQSSDKGGSETLIRAVQLPFGERWAWRLKVITEDILPMPLPAVSGSTVALLHAEWSQGNRENRPSMRLLDLSRGSLEDTQVLNKDFDASKTITFHALGNALIVQGDRRIEIFTE